MRHPVPDPSASAEDRDVHPSDDPYARVTRSARSIIATGGRPSYTVQYQPDDGGALVASVDEIPGLRIQVAGRKGVEKAAKGWIALLLELPEDEFDVIIQRARGHRSRSPESQR